MVVALGALVAFAVLSACSSGQPPGHDPWSGTPPPNSAPVVSASYDTSTAVQYDLCSAGAARAPLTCSMSFAALNGAIDRGELRPTDSIKKPSMPVSTMAAVLPEFQSRWGAGDLPASLKGVYSVNLGGDVRTLTLPQIAAGVADRSLPMKSDTLVKIPSMPKEIFSAAGLEEFAFLFP